MFDGHGDEDGEAPGEEDFAPGRQVAGFTLRRRLDTGGAARVYLAERGGRRFALKLVPMGQWGERELEALRRVRDTSVVGLLGYGQWPELAPRFLVLELEWVDGPALDAWARRAAPSARELVERVFLPLARALVQVHAAGVVHRDVKEANVVMRQEDGVPVLVDFGAAAYEGAPRLTRRLPPGTPEYRSPEMLRFAREWEGEPYASRPSDDCWALGVTLYVLLTRVLPFGDRHGPLVRAILEHTPEPPHARNPRVPPALGALCLRLLDKVPERRCAQAPLLVQALEDALAGADDAWRVPLFAAPAADAPVRPERRASPRPWLRHVALGVLGGLFLLAPGPATPRAGSPTPRPPPEAGFRREIAPPSQKAEVAPGAEPAKSPLPAPVARATHREDKPMRKPSPGRAPVTPTVLTAAAACLGAACATVPRPPPPPAECPPGFYATLRRFNLSVGQHHLAALAPQDQVTKPPTKGFTQVRDGGPSQAEAVMDWEQLPARTRMEGTFYFTPEGVRGRYTRLILDSGETLPLCAIIEYPIQKQPGSTDSVAVVWAFQYLELVHSFP